MFKHKIEITSFNQTTNEYDIIVQNGLSFTIPIHAFIMPLYGSNQYYEVNKVGGKFFYKGKQMKFSHAEEGIVRLGVFTDPQGIEYKFQAVITNLNVVRQLKEVKQSVLIYNNNKNIYINGFIGKIKLS